MPIALPISGAEPPAPPPLPYLTDAAQARVSALARQPVPRGSLALLAGALMGVLAGVLVLLCWPAASLGSALGCLVLAPLAGAALAHGLARGLHWHEVFPMC